MGTKAGRAWLHARYRSGRRLGIIDHCRLGGLVAEDADVMRYWVSGTVTSSTRLYRESFAHKRLDRPGKIPTGVAIYPR